MEKKLERKGYLLIKCPVWTDWIKSKPKILLCGGKSIFWIFNVTEIQVKDFRVIFTGMKKRISFDKISRLNWLNKKEIKKSFKKITWIVWYKLIRHLEIFSKLFHSEENDNFV